VNDRTYLNSAYIAPMVQPAVVTGTEYLQAKSGRPLLVAELLGNDETVRKQFAKLVNATPDDVGLLFATGEGENVIANGLDWKSGDNVVLSELCYPIPFIVYRVLEERHGVELRIARHRHGAVEASDFEPLVDRRTRVVTAPWVSHLNGYHHDMRAIADLAHAHGAICYADSVQATGMFPIDVKASAVDALCSGTYKWLLAGFGVAPLYVTPELNDRLKIDRFGEFMVTKELPDHRFEFDRTARRFDYGSRAFGAVFQLHASLAYLEKVGVDRIAEHTIGLAHRLSDAVAKQGFELFTPPGNRSSIVAFYVRKAADQVRTAFHAANIEVTVRNDALRPDNPTYVRVGIGLFNTADEVDKLLEVTQRMA